MYVLYVVEVMVEVNVNSQIVLENLQMIHLFVHPKELVLVQIHVHVSMVPQEIVPVFLVLESYQIVQHLSVMVMEIALAMSEIFHFSIHVEWTI